MRLPGVVESRCAGDDPAYGYRYDGLKLIMQAADRYVFIPHNWTPGGGPRWSCPAPTPCASNSLRPEGPGAGPAEARWAVVAAADGTVTP